MGIKLRDRPAAPFLSGRPAYPGRMQPILHLSIPVRDLAEAQEFYVGTLGCQAARVRPSYTDVWFFGMQLTLQDRPDDVTPLAAGVSRGSGVTRHFGVTLDRDDFDEAI